MVNPTIVRSKGGNFKSLIRFLIWEIILSVNIIPYKAEGTNKFCFLSLFPQY